MVYYRVVDASHSLGSDHQVVTYRWISHLAPTTVPAVFQPLPQVQLFCHQLNRQRKAGGRRSMHFVYIDFHRELIHHPAPFMDSIGLTFRGGTRSKWIHLKLQLVALVSPWQPCSFSLRWRVSPVTAGPSVCPPQSGVRRSCTRFVEIPSRSQNSLNGINRVETGLTCCGPTKPYNLFGERVSCSLASIAPASLPVHLQHVYLH